MIPLSGASPALAGPGGRLSLTLEVQGLRQPRSRPREGGRWTWKQGGGDER